MGCFEQVLGEQVGDVADLGERAKGSRGDRYDEDEEVVVAPRA